ncbi:hypothetical protein HPB52_020413 [Rhipicephalus sanguineus]|uniref:Uncharacterized protein n=1 Tax=Rhipicephalus sanguineus TaxID=34632 RepID=A0A9D4QEB7_RHISA|nr:hypothetical protein HPB52_020413 [Rhipicephalus sanguineus]
MNRSPTSARQRSPDDQASRRLRGDSPEFSPLHFTPRGTQTTDAATMTSQAYGMTWKPCESESDSVIREELSKFQAPQTTTALSVVDVVRDDLRQLMWEPDRTEATRGAQQCSSCDGGALPADRASRCATSDGPTASYRLQRVA